MGYPIIITVKAIFSQSQRTKLKSKQMLQRYAGTEKIEVTHKYRAIFINY